MLPIPCALQRNIEMGLYLGNFSLIATSFKLLLQSLHGVTFWLEIKLLTTTYCNTACYNLCLRMLPFEKIHFWLLLYQCFFIGYHVQDRIWKLDIYKFKMTVMSQILLYHISLLNVTRSWAGVAVGFLSHFHLEVGVNCNNTNNNLYGYDSDCDLC